jgi:hypothetical protein
MGWDQNSIFAAVKSSDVHGFCLTLEGKLKPEERSEHGSRKPVSDVPNTVSCAARGPQDEGSA